VKGRIGAVFGGARLGVAERRRAGGHIVVIAGVETGDERLEQLADDAERKVALELAASRLGYREPGGRRRFERGFGQARLPDSRGPFDQHHSALAGEGALGKLHDRCELGVALEEVVCGRLEQGGSIIGALRAAWKRLGNSLGLLPDAKRGLTG
jgi:hypothetical protein